jgi:hypothetical protein
MGFYDKLIENKSYNSLAKIQTNKDIHGIHYKYKLETMYRDGE